MGVLYRPAHQWQGENDAADKDPYGWFGCGAHSVAMGVDAVSGGAIVPTGHEIRDLTDEAVPKADDPGLTLEQLIAATIRFGMHWILRKGVGFNVLENDLKQHRWIVVNLWYAALPSKYRFQASAAFGHAEGAMAISSDGLNVLMYDPLAHAAHWVPLAVLRTAAEEWGRRTGYPGKVVYMASVARIPVVNELAA